MTDDTPLQDLARRLLDLAEELEALVSPARPYAHRCTSCGVPISPLPGSGLCQGCSH